MLVTQMLSAMQHAGMFAASDDMRDGVPYDADYAQERAEATAMAYGRTEHLPMNAIRDLTNEWLKGYREGYMSEVP